MVGNISQLLEFHRDPFAWYCRRVRLRQPRGGFSAALAVGTMVHDALAAILEGEFIDGALDDYAKATADNADLCQEQYRSEFHREAAKGAALVKAWVPAFPIAALLGAEKQLEAPLNDRHYLIGRLDAVVHLEWGGVVHLQHKTRAWNKPMDPFMESSRVSPHELGYNYLLSANYPSAVRTVWMNVGVKERTLAAIGPASWHQRLLPLEERHIASFLDSAIRDFDEMEAIREGASPRVHWEAAISERGYLSPYFRVMTGEASLDDETLFQDTPPDYADLATLAGARP